MANLLMYGESAYGKSAYGKSAYGKKAYGKTTYSFSSITYQYLLLVHKNVASNQRVLTVLLKDNSDQWKGVGIKTVIEYDRKIFFRI